MFRNKRLAAHPCALRAAVLGVPDCDLFVLAAPLERLFVALEKQVDVLPFYVAKSDRESLTDALSKVWTDNLPIIVSGAEDINTPAISAATS